MKRTTTLLLALSTAGVLLTGCTKKGDPGPAGPAGATGATGPTGPAGTTLSGSIVGFANPYDEFGLALATKSGFTVTLEGVTPVRTATTDATGRYEFQNVPTGTYNLLYQKAGFGDFRRLGLTHIGGTQPTNAGGPNVVQITSTRPVLARYLGATSTSYTFNLGLANAAAPAGSLLRGIMYFSTLPTVTSANADFLVSFSLSGSTSSNATVNVAKTLFTSTNGVPVGTTLYAVVYGAPSLLTAYTDLTTGRLTYTGLNPTPSAVFSFTVQ